MLIIKTDNRPNYIRNAKNFTLEQFIEFAEWFDSKSGATIGVDKVE